MFKYVRQPGGSETPRLWDFSGVLHLDLIWLKAKWNAWNNRTGCICFSLRPFSGLTKQRVLHPARPFKSSKIDFQTELLVTQSSIVSPPFRWTKPSCWVKKSHTVVTASASYTGCAVTRRGTVAESTCPWNSAQVSYPSLSWIMPPHRVNVNPSAHQPSGCSNRLLWTIGLIWFCCCKDMDI